MNVAVVFGNDHTNSVGVIQSCLLYTSVMYCNEIFNPDKPDTYFDKVKK